MFESRIKGQRASIGGGCVAHEKIWLLHYLFHGAYGDE